MSAVTYVDVGNTKSSFADNDYIIVQDNVSSSATAQTKFDAMKKCELSNLKLYMQNGMTITLTMDSSTYVLTATLKNSSGTTLSTQSVDLPLESMVVSGRYDADRKMLILTLKSGSTIEISISGLISGLVNTSDIQDNLTSTETAKPLSAKQGKVLNEAKVNISDIKDNLTSTDTDKPLSAKQGKVLNDAMVRAVKITSLSTTLADVKTLLAQTNNALFDVSAFGANAKLCTMFMDSVTSPTIFKVVDIVRGRTYQTDYSASTLLSSVLALAYDLATENEIEDLQEQIDELKEAAVGDDTVFNYVKSLTVSSSSGNLSFTVNDEQNFINAVNSCEAQDYLLVWNGSAWTYNGSTITNFGITVTGTPTTGEVMKVTPTIVQELYTLVDDEQTGTNATVPSDSTITDYFIAEKKYVENTKRVNGTDVAKTFNFDAPESAICVTEGYTLSAGKYYIYNVEGSTSDYWCNYKRLYYCFEIANDIIATSATGDIQLRFSSRGDRETTGDARGIYQLYCKPYKCIDDTLYNSDTITFVGQVAQPSSEYTDFRTVTNFNTVQTMDENGVGLVYNNLGHVCYGNNEWNVSNLKQLMNSDAKSMTPTRLHRNDIVTGLKNQRGLLWGLDPRVKAKIATAVVSQEHGLNDEFTKYAIYTDTCTAFLLSMKEMSFNIQTDEGLVTDLYGQYTGNVLTNNAVAARGKADKEGVAPSSYRWSRTAYANNSNFAWRVSAAGAGGSYYANDGNRFAPAYILKNQ